MKTAAVPLSAIAEALWRILPHTTSSQLALLHEMRRTLPDALAARCEEIERSVKPTATAPRPCCNGARMTPSSATHRTAWRCRC